jgi:hypothetical protein
LYTQAIWEGQFPKWEAKFPGFTWIIALRPVRFLTSGSSNPLNPASQSVLFMANAKRGNFSRVSGQLGDTKIQQSTKGADFAPENRRLGTPVSGSHFSIS